MQGKKTWHNITADHFQVTGKAPNAHHLLAHDPEPAVDPDHGKRKRPSEMTGAQKKGKICVVDEGSCNIITLPLFN